MNCTDLILKKNYILVVNHRQDMQSQGSLQQGLNQLNELNLLITSLKNI